MYANILLSTDGSDVARKGVEHGIGLAKALNAKVTVITVTEPLKHDAFRFAHSLNFENSWRIRRV
jgi:nucleotide-binding universal stress UspA family protein